MQINNDSDRQSQCASGPTYSVPAWPQKVPAQNPKDAFFFNPLKDPEAERALVSTCQAALDSPYRYDALNRLQDFYNKRSYSGPGHYDPVYSKKAIDCLEALEVMEPGNISLRVSRYGKLLNLLSHDVCGKRWDEGADSGLLIFDPANSELHPTLREIFKEASQILWQGKEVYGIVTYSLGVLLKYSHSEEVQNTIDVFLLPALRLHRENNTSEEIQRLVELAERRTSAT